MVDHISERAHGLLHNSVLHSHFSLKLLQHTQSTLETDDSHMREEVKRQKCDVRIATSAVIFFFFCVCHLQSGLQSLNCEELVRWWRGRLHCCAAVLAALKLQHVAILEMK